MQIFKIYIIVLYFWTLDEHLVHSLETVLVTDTCEHTLVHTDFLVLGAVVEGRQVHTLGQADVTGQPTLGGATGRDVILGHD